jgi:hypothetical protein
MSDPVSEMKLAALLVEHEHFMGLCEGGFPLVAFEERCRFCGADHAQKCKRVTQSPAHPSPIENTEAGQ